MNLKRLLPAGLIALVSLTAIDCVTAAFHNERVFKNDAATITVGRTYEKTLNYKYDFADFEPIPTTVARLDLKPTESDETTEYNSAMNNAVSLMRQGKYKDASEALDKMSRRYKDDGLALYNLGVCYANTKDYQKALTSLANSYAAGFSEAFRVIDNVHALLAYECFQEHNYPDAIRYYKTVPADTNISMNVIYSYMEIAKTFPYPKNLMMLLYAGNYIVDNGVLDKNILGLGGEIGKQLGDSPVEAYLPNAIAVLEYLAKATGNPWTHINLGMLYAHNKQPELAKAQYQLAVQRAGGDADALRFATGRLVETGTVNYAYLKEIPFTVTLKGGDLASASFEGTFAVPQNNYEQTVTGLTVMLNGKPVAFNPLKDRYQADLISLNVTGALRAGDNTLSIKAAVSKTARRFPAPDLASVTTASFDRRSAQYKLYTESSKIYNLVHPLVKKAVVDIKTKLKKNDLASVARAVYDYVMEKMSYELYDNAARPKEEILNRVQKTKYVGLCEDYAVFTAAILRSFGIPALVMAGPTLGSEIGHAWPVFFTPRFDQAIILDTTWGDTGEMPNYYFLFNTNQNVVENVGWDSDVLPGAEDFSFRHSGNIDIVMKKEKDTITK